MLEPAIAHILASIAWCIVECSMLIVRLYEVPSAVAGGLGILEISRASRSLLLLLLLPRTSRPSFPSSAHVASSFTSSPRSSLYLLDLSSYTVNCSYYSFLISQWYVLLLLAGELRAAAPTYPTWQFLPHHLSPVQTLLVGVNVMSNVC